MRRTARWFLCFLLGAGLSSATTVIPMSVERLAESSSHVLQGKAVQSWSEWNAQHTLIYTYTKFQVSSAWKGQAPAMVVVKQPGGKVDATTERVYGVRYLRQGEDSVLFLRPSEERDGTLIITGLVQGNFRVRTSRSGTAVVSNGMAEVSSYSVASHEVAPFTGSTMRLEDLKARVQKAVQP
jgi:hypothetical protein